MMYGIMISKTHVIEFFFFLLTKEIFVSNRENEMTFYKKKLERN